MGFHKFYLVIGFYVYHVTSAREESRRYFLVGLHSLYKRSLLKFRLVLKFFHGVNPIFGYFIRKVFLSSK